MAGRRTGTDRDEQLKRARGVLRLTGRITALTITLLLSTLVGVQFARAIGENLAAKRELSSIQSDITALEKRRDDQRREMLRLRDPEGAIPEIHDRLRLVRPNEALIFVYPQAATPKPLSSPEP
jgi:cell division protein FtsB